MIIYLMRHGHALDVGEEGVRSDRERPLSRKGTGIVRDVAEALVTLGVTLDYVATSPLLRARQTAEIVAKVMGDVPLDNCPLLAPCGSYPELIQWLRHDKFKSIMLVGHMPDLSEFASAMICGHSNAGLNFKKAAVCRVTFDSVPETGRGVLEWLLPPSIAARLD